MSQRHGLTREQFRLVNSKGKTSQSPLFNLKSLSLKNEATYKLTVVIPSKLVKLVVDRQKLRRQIKAITAKIITEPIGIIFYLKEPAKKATYKELEIAITSLLTI